MTSSTNQNSYVAPTQSVEITSIGIISPVGINAEMTAASIRAGISSYEESNILNKDLNPIVMSLVPDDALPDLADELSELPLSRRQQRMLKLATPAIQQLDTDPEVAIPLMLCAPEKMPGKRSAVTDDFLKYLAVQSGIKLNLNDSYVFAQGKSSGLYALEAAMQLFETTQHQYIILGGVDSFLDLDLLTYFDEKNRLLSEGVMDSFAPGEAAVFLVLKRSDAASQCKINPPGLAEEVGHRYSTQAYKGEGLASAVTEAVVNRVSTPIKSVFASFNGENFNAKEWGVALIRNKSNFHDDYQMIHPSDCYGDIGAATAPMLLALSLLGIKKGYYEKPALLFTSSEIQQRAAVLIS